jgi:hypothetical protein
MLKRLVRPELPGEIGRIPPKDRGFRALARGKSPSIRAAVDLPLRKALILLGFFVFSS